MQAHDSDSTAKRLLAEGKTNSVTVIFPAPGNMTVFCIVEDSLSAATERSKALLVNPCTVDCDQEDPVKTMMLSGNGKMALSMIAGGTNSGTITVQYAQGC